MKKYSYPSVTDSYILLLSVVSFFILLWTPFSGDDWAYMGAFSGANASYASWIYYPKWVWGHWITTNGRLANYIAPILLNIPYKWVVALLCAVMQWLMMKSAVLCSVDRNNSVVGALIVTLLALTLPWWDSMQVFDCQLNYVWATALSLTAIYVIFKKLTPTISVAKAILYSLLCGCAGMMHEACSLPLCIGLCFYVVVNRSIKLRGLSLLPIFVFFVATAIATLSPGIIMRATTYVEPDDSMLGIIAKSDVIAAFLCILLVVLFAIPSMRSRVITILKSTTGVFVVAALVSMVISMFSGVVGRSGWFAEAFAIIALADIITPYLNRPKVVAKSVIGVISILAIANYFITMIWQYKLDKEFAEFTTLYKASDNGLVFYDFTRDNDVSMATLNRTRGVPDADDAYLLSTLAGYYATDSVWPTILPSEIQTLNVDTISSCKLLCGDFVTSSLPKGAKVYTNSRDKLNIYLVEIDGIDWVVQPFVLNGRQLYHVSKRILDPGDR